MYDRSKVAAYLDALTSGPALAENAETLARVRAAVLTIKLAYGEPVAALARRSVHAFA